MGKATGHVNNHDASRSLRRKTYASRTITITNGGTSGLVQCIGKTPVNARFAVESVTVVNETAISNHVTDATNGSIAVGHATATGTFDADSILDEVAITHNTNAKVLTTYTKANFPTTLKNAKGTLASGYPIVPSNSTIWTTATSMITNGTGTAVVFVSGWELDDEKE